MKNMKEIMHHAKLKTQMLLITVSYTKYILKKHTHKTLTSVSVKFNVLQKWAYFLFWF